MTTYNTGNPLGSAAAKDLFDNAQNLDFALNDITSLIWTDRLGKTRPSFYGVESAFTTQLTSQESRFVSQLSSQESRFTTFIQSSGYDVIGDYEDGPLTITEYNQLIRYDGELWKLTAATDIPFTTSGNNAASWATDSPHFLSVGDGALRQGLSQIDGISSIGSGSYAEIRSYIGGNEKITCFGRENITDGAGGVFVRDDADTTTADNGGTVLVDALNRRWKRVYEGDVLLTWFCSRGDGVTNYTAPIQAAAQVAVDNDKNLIFEYGTYPFTTIQVQSSTIRKAATKWIANGAVTLHCIKTSPDSTDYDADYAIRVQGRYSSQVDVTADAVRGAGIVYLADVSTIEVGDLVGLQSSRLIQTDHRGQAREGQLCKVSSVNTANSRVGIENTLRYYAPSSITQTGTITAATSGSSFTASGLTLTRRNAKVRIRFTSGNNNGQIRYVTAYSGSTLTIGGDQSAFTNTPAVGDTFVLEWVTVASIIKPLKFTMSTGFSLTRDVTSNATAGDVGFRGLDILYTDKADITGVVVEGFSETGIRVRGSYQPHLVNPTVRDANRGYNTFDGTGYGISINQCFGAIVDEFKTFRCRKGLDVIGTQMISWETRVSGTASGGGVDYTGTAFWPVGVTENSGIGSHGAGYDSMYHYCLVVDCHLPYAMRGLRESYIGCRVQGNVAGPCLRLAYGGDLTVKNMIYDDTFTEIGQTVDTSYSQDSRPSLRATCMVELFCGATDGYLRGYPVVVQGCHAKKLTLGFVVASGAGDTLTLENLFLGQNTAYVSIEGTSTTEFSFIRTEGLKVAKNVQDQGGNRYIRDGGTWTSWTMYDLRTALTIPDNTFLRLADNKVFATILDDSVIAIPISPKTKTAMISIFDHEIDRNYRGLNMLLYVNRALDYNNASYKTGITLANSVLTGTTSTDGTMNIAFLPSGGGGYLYIENRMGATMRPIIVIETVPF
ncbi:hypothetical protein [Leclercia adecarboxylata]|uniref:hypothetical protein n=1 Tax=Leclercia adecarboxylata TaxID=83655 RepID=UPI0025513778|nr:hypothetical protein [Leclercia adecarboxylata]